MSTRTEQLRQSAHSVVSDRGLRDIVVALPSTLLALVLAVIPLVFLLYQAFTPFFTLAHFLSAVSGVSFETLLQSLFTGGVATILCLLIAYPVTYWLAHSCPKRYRITILLAFTLPLWLNYVILNYSWVSIFARDGLLNYVLVDLGPLTQPLELLYTRVSLLVGFVYIYLPYVLMTLYVSMERLDYKLIEAARDLGANDPRVFVDVVFPQTIAGVAAGALIVYARIAGAFVTPEVLGGPRQQMISRLIVNAFYKYLDWEYAAALSSVFLVVVLLLFGVTSISSNVREELKQW